MINDNEAFMIFELSDSGERVRLQLTEKEFCDNNGKNILHHTQVIIIAKESQRKIFIWKGLQAPVRKKFIASRVASELQSELTKSAKFHNCKIISVDQGEEPQDFFDSFGFKTENIPKVEKSIEPEISSLEQNKTTISVPKVVNTKIIPSKIKTLENIKNERELKKVLEKVIQIPVPENCIRKNVIVGNNLLYGNVCKKMEVFGQKIEKTEWEPVNNLPKEMFELEGDKLRIHFNQELGEIEAIEILEKNTVSKLKVEENTDSDYSKWTIKQLKAFCAEKKINIPSLNKKAEILLLVKEFIEKK